MEHQYAVTNLDEVDMQLHYNEGLDVVGVTHLLKLLL